MISVILPTYNERDNIGPLVAEIHRVLICEHEILVIDDDSSDGTYDIARGLDVKAMHRKDNRGLAYSIRCGIENATGDIVVMDSDFNHKPEYLPFMVESLRYYDCVAASRFVYGGKMEPRARHLASWASNLFVRLATGGQITDNLYGYFAIRRDVLGKIDLNRVFWGHGDYYMRLLYYLQKNHTSILQFGAVNGARLNGESHYHLTLVFWKYLKETVRLSLEGRLDG